MLNLGCTALPVGSVQQGWSPRGSPQAIAGLHHTCVCPWAGIFMASLLSTFSDEHPMWKGFFPYFGRLGSTRIAQWLVDLHTHGVVSYTHIGTSFGFVLSWRLTWCSTSAVASYIFAGIGYIHFLSIHLVFALLIYFAGASLPILG